MTWAEEDNLGWRKITWSWGGTGLEHGAAPVWSARAALLRELGAAPMGSSACTGREAGASQDGGGQVARWTDEAPSGSTGTAWRPWKRGNS